MEQPRTSFLEYLFYVSLDGWLILWVPVSALQKLLKMCFLERENEWLSVPNRTFIPSDGDPTAVLGRHFLVVVVVRLPGQLHLHTQLSRGED